ncbi:MAG: pyridoxamine 5'-phosphate oxidase family protein [Burkholderiales bacterium]|nr:pyridoxamine 5'-phosphate oxidase family protein [Burkholderiales bacterium]
MEKIEGNCREVCEATEFVAMVTTGDDGPHLVGNWGDYMRTLGVEEKRIVLPAGRYHQTERNLGENGRILLMVASRKVQGSRTPGQGYVISGTARIVSSGDAFDRVKARYPWARGAMVIDVESVKAQL